MQLQISSLTVKNCGALKDVKIDLTDTLGDPQAVTVLVGTNGSGKTTVLELIFALADLLKSAPHTGYAPQNVQEIINRTEYAEMDLLIDGTTCHLFLGQPSINVSIHNIKHGMRRENNNHAMKYYIQSSAYIINSGISERIWQSQANAVSELKNNDAIPSILYFPNERALPLIKVEQIKRADVKYRWCYRYENRHFQNSLEHYLIWLDYADQATFKSVIDFINQLDLGGKTFHINRKRFNVVVRTRDGNEHPFNQLSYGEQSVLIILLDLWRRLLPGSIVLIDEIEKSLHPAFQHRLAKNLRQLQQQIPFQLILTTHQHTFVKIFGEQCARTIYGFRK